MTQTGLGESEAPSFYIKYGSGMVRGHVVQDDIEMGEVKLKQARFGEVGSESGTAFVKGHFSGIVGLAFPSLAAANMYPLFDQVIDQKVLKDNEFAFFFSNRVDKPSRLMLGDSAKGSWTGELAVHDVITNNYWAIRMVDVMVGDERMNLCPDEGCKVAVDTGTSLITGPSFQLQQLLNKLDIHQECVNWDDIKDMSLLLEATKPDGSKYIKPYPLSKKDFVFEMKDDKGVRKTCTPGLMALDVPQPRGPLWILGDLFMMKYFTQYNRNTNQIKMGLAKEESDMQEESETETMLSSMLQEDETHVVTLDGL